MAWAAYKVQGHPKFEALKSLAGDISRRCEKHRQGPDDFQYLTYRNATPEHLVGLDPTYGTSRWHVPEGIRARFNRVRNRILKDLGVKDLLPWDWIRLYEEQTKKPD
jgi:hypothetical protein